MPPSLLPVPHFPSLLASWLDALASIDSIQEVLVLTGRPEDTNAIDLAIESSGTMFANSAGAILDRADHRGTAGALRDVVLDRSIENRILLVEGTSMPAGNLASIFDPGIEDESVEGVFARTDSSEPAGALLLKARAFDLVPEVGFFDLKEQLLPRVIEQEKKILVRSVGAETIRLTQPEDYLDLVRALGRRGDSTRSTGPWIHPNAQVDPSAIIGENVLIDEGVQVGPGSIIQRSVLLKGAQVGSDALIARSIVRPNLQIAPKARLIDSDEVLLDARGTWSRNATRTPFAISKPPLAGTGS